MSFNSIYEIAGSSLAAQSLRLNTIASNLANADSAAADPADAYQARKPVFEAVYQSFGGDGLEAAKVEVTDIINSDAPIDWRYQPNHPFANDEGMVAYSNVDTVEEVADMMAATQSFEASVNVLNQARSMQQSLLQLGNK